MLRVLLDRLDGGFGPGHLAFGTRRNPVHWANVVLGDALTHSAVVASIDGELRTIEMGPHGCFSRPADEFRAAYRFTGHARPDMSPACAAAVAARAEQELDLQRLKYSWGACALIGGAGFARRFGRASWEAPIVRGVVKVATVAARRWSPDAVTCSGFVARCLMAACPACRPQLRWPARDRVAPWRAAVTTTDARPASPAAWPSCDDAVTEILTSPSDLWVADGMGVRSVVTPTLTTVLVDLSGRCQRRGPCHRARTTATTRGGDR